MNKKLTDGVCAGEFVIMAEILRIKIFTKHKSAMRPEPLSVKIGPQK